MEFKKFLASVNDDGRRLDKIIRIFLPELTLTLIYKYIRKGLIKVNSRNAKNDTRISAGDEILIADFIVKECQNPDSSDAEKEKPFASLPDLKIVFKNEHILVVDKPYDITVHGNADSLDHKVLEYYKSQDSADNSLSFRPGPLHRLDRKTTGLLCFSMSLLGAQWFSENIKNHTLQKKYACILQGKLSKAQLWQDFINKDDEKESFKTVTAKGEKNSDSDKNCITYVTPLSYGVYNNKDVTFALMDIKTGRTHQIRAQSALHGFPLLGDSAYGGVKIASKKGGKNPMRDFYLQAFLLTFPKENPLGLPEQIKIPLSSDFKSFLKSCSINEIGL